MSGFARPHCRSWSARLTAGTVVAALLAAAPGVPAAGQTPTVPPAGGTPFDTTDDATRPPLPPGRSATPAAKYRVPNPTRAMFAGAVGPDGAVSGGIEDDKPLASEKDNPDEATAWLEVLRHAVQFPAAELEAAADRDLTPDDLIYPSRKFFRLQLVRFDGTLLKVRKLDHPTAGREAGVPALYEGWLLPADEAPAAAVCVVFADPPAGIDVPAGDDWTTVNRPATFAGYSFKLASDVLETGRSSPVLVGRGVTFPPPGPAADPRTSLAKGLRVFQGIRDDATIAVEKDGRNWEEGSAWARVLLHARRFSPDQLDATARRDVSFADLFKDDSRPRFKLDLVRFEGRMYLLRKLDTAQASRRLSDAGVDAVYEGWLVPANDPAGRNPVCVVFTDLPPGIKATGKVNYYVAFAGWSFKLLRYDSRQQVRNDKEQTSTSVEKRAPLLLGRGLLTRPDPDAAVSFDWGTRFVPVVVGVLVLVIGTILLLSWVYRRGDREAAKALDAPRNVNPFAD